ncbi:hypothetical protein HJC99_00175 [Candidatus Saccharibacteria bacterium]|nr:hypothetical protein [Candidatus Saccharibacteria bacterium]
MWLAFFIVGIIAIVGLWKIFTKAGNPGWAAIIPIYNTYILLEIVGRPAWSLLILLFIPFVNLVLFIILALDLAKSFGKSAVFGVFGLIIFPYIGSLILGFGPAIYQGPCAGVPSNTPPVAPAV